MQAIPTSSPFDQAPITIERPKIKAAIIRAAIAAGFVQPEYTMAQLRSLRLKGKLSHKGFVAALAGKSWDSR